MFGMDAIKATAIKYLVDTYFDGDLGKLHATRDYFRGRLDDPEFSFGRIHVERVIKLFDDFLENMR